MEYKCIKCPKLLPNYIGDKMRILVGAFYEICELNHRPTGSHLHILLDDDNLDDDDIAFCMKECMLHPDDPESSLGILICQEYLKLDMMQRNALVYTWEMEGLCIHPNCLDTNNKEDIPTCLLIRD